MNTYSKIITSRPTLQILVQKLGLRSSVEQLATQINVEIPANTELMHITVTDQNPILATDIANTLAEFIKTDLAGTHTVDVIEPAIPVQEQSTPRHGFNIASGLLIGLIGGLGLAFLFENLDTTLYSTKRIVDVTQLPLLGMIPAIKKQRKATVFNNNSPEAEAFLRLRTNIFALNQAESLRTILVTSAEANEGKSTVVANLANAIARSGKQVLIIDGDLRLPTVHKFFALSNEVGLSNVLKQEVNFDQAIQPTGFAGVQVLTSGPPHDYPDEALGSRHMSTLIEELLCQFEIILLDTPSLLAVIDAAVLAPVADCVVLVVGRTQVREEAVLAACQQLASVKANPIGVVVNRAEQDMNYQYYHRARV